MAAIELSNGGFAQVDETDVAAVLAAGGWYSKRPPRRYATYVQRKVQSPSGGRSTQFLRTFLTGWKLVDHKSGDGLDNRRGNLRQATTAQNAINKRVSKNSETGFKGVTLNKKTGRFYARISIGGRTRHLGAFATAESAALRHDEMARTTYGDFACLNFPAEGERGARPDAAMAVSA
jgi:hypothetical protein